MSAGEDGVAGPDRSSSRRRALSWWLLAGLLAAFSLGFLVGLGRPHAARPR